MHGRVEQHAMRIRGRWQVEAFYTVPSIGTDVQYSRFHGVGCNVMGVWDTVGAGSVGPIHTCRHTV